MHWAAQVAIVVGVVALGLFLLSRRGGSDVPRRGSDGNDVAGVIRAGSDAVVSIGGLFGAGNTQYQGTRDYQAKAKMSLF